MQNLVSSCISNRAADFLLNTPDNTIHWVTFSNIKATSPGTFGRSTRSGNVQQIIAVGQSGSVAYYYLTKGFGHPNFQGVLNHAPISADQVSLSIAAAISSIGTQGYANLATISITPWLTKMLQKKQPPSPSPPSIPSPTFLESGSLGLSTESLFVPVCGGKPNWLSIGIYGVTVVVLLLLWWWLKRLL